MKLISLNIEMDRHYQTIVPFIKKELPDIVCLQEVYEEDLPFLLENLPPYRHRHFAPMTLKKENAEARTFGTLILSDQPTKLLGRDYYYSLNKDPLDLPWFDKPNGQNTSHNVLTVNKVLTVVEVTIDDIPYVVGTTHFTWSPDGKVSPQQKKDLPNLLKISTKYPELVLCGDFNIPRGRDPLWGTLCEHYTDNIPAHIDNTLDNEFHRVPGIKRAVDGMFTTPGYTVTDIEIKCGVSDHCAIVAQIEKTKTAA